MNDELYCECERADDRPCSCYCDEDEGCGYTFSDEYGPCDYCLGYCTLCDGLVEED